MTVPARNAASRCAALARPSQTALRFSVPTGGNELLVINAEARIPVPLKKGLSIVPFYDGGNVFP